MYGNIQMRDEAYHHKPSKEDGNKDCYGEKTKRRAAMHPRSHGFERGQEEARPTVTSYAEGIGPSERLFEC